MIDEMNQDCHPLDDLIPDMAANRGEEQKGHQEEGQKGKEREEINSAGTSTGENPIWCGTTY